jgi:hypothetical protein
VDVLLGLGEGPDGLEGVHFWGLDPDSISMLCSWNLVGAAFSPRLWPIS